MVRFLALVLVLVASGAHAGPLWMTGFDGVDTSTTDVDLFEMTECGGAGCGTDSFVNVQQTRVHDATNGGTSSSLWSGQANVTGTGTGSGFYGAIPDINPRESGLWLSAAINVDTPPPSGKTRSILCVREQDNDYGCCAGLDNNRQLTLFYAGGASLGACTTDANCAAGQTCQGGTCRLSWGTAPSKLETRSCQGNVQLPCTAANQTTDCPSGVCSGTTYYWAGVEVAELISTTTVVTCELHIDGTPVFTGTPKTVTGVNLAAPMKNAMIGIVDGPGTVSGTANIFFDDFVMGDDERVGFGYVARKVPSVSGSLKEWAPQSGNNCTTSNRVACVNDYAVSPFNYWTPSTANVIQKTAVNKTENYSATTPDIAVPTGAKVTAFEVVSFGNTSNGTGLRDMQLGMLIGPDLIPSLSPNTVVLASGNRTAPGQWMRWLIRQSGVPGNQDLLPFVNEIGIQVSTGTGLVDVLKVGALLVYIWVKKPDITGSPTLTDHNEGAEDGKIAVYGIGDSTLAGTVENDCIGGTNNGGKCTQFSYASWDTFALGGQQDLPAGGCASSAEYTGGTCSTANTNDICDQRVRTCTLSRAQFNAGAGFRCVATGDCQLSCVSNVCESPDGQTPVLCPGGTNAECNLGTCDTTATCIESCPGGQCPTDRVGWLGGVPSRVLADVWVACGQGGEKMSEMYGTRFDAILDGKHSSCIAVSGSGQCTCTVGTQAADCGAGGVCGGAGFCTAGDFTKVQCQQTIDCNQAGGRLCAFPPPDYVITNEGYNEMNPCTFVGSCPFSAINPVANNCDTSLAWRNPVPLGCPTTGTGRWQQAATACDDDADCASVSPRSVCGGWCLTGTDAGCGVHADCGSGGTCSTQISPCKDNSAGGCGNFFALGGPTCLNGAKSILPADARGTCRCTTDANCFSGWKCVGETGKGACRKGCTTDADCATGRTSACVTYAGSIGNGVKVCQGRCTIPCDAITCATDLDCAPAGGITGGHTYGGLAELRWWGTCNKARGRCANCGPIVCAGNQIAEPCSCAVNTDCDGTAPGTGVCTNNVCTAGGSERKACWLPSDCGPGFQCMRPDEQFNRQHIYRDLPIKVAQLMMDKVQRLGETTPPRLLFMTPPQVNGMVPTGAIIGDSQCKVDTGSIAAFYDRDFLSYVRTQYLTAPWLPARYVIDVGPTWNAVKQTTAVHSDQVHYTALGGSVLAPVIAGSLNKLGVCVKADGVTPQLYCMAANGSFPSNVTCTSNAGCSASICVARKCSGNNANCPDSGDTCGAD